MSSPSSYRHDPSFHRGSGGGSNRKRRRRDDDEDGEDGHDDHQRQRKAKAARMARLRAENEAEERKLERLQEETQQHQAELDAQKRAKTQIVEVKEEELEGLSMEQQMQALLGFSGGFDSTKEKKVEDNHTSAAKGVAQKHKARKYRQYMNRKGGFNRPLEKMT
mmetsp:Transcript_42322/g.62807  ORF Transcript_42322/g.62807 Transcript_42322/m.62807 type:complete len:164 (-) Transcript_42322:420-911(-)|eukprot:CAMPEP_0194031400 /NCGR_PEP_ID=MMETSP0009_2-20130614/4579_1 /TAXON_ID=210454 /ORGANISM="Grammatophora oceanica, Strain CCMP 410" /LENGTH=163 /DNA_ID=CAMNT_0038671541 /DNA_START=159 /DNA_END=650 /DNA_ORIENTATION=-